MARNKAATAAGAAAATKGAATATKLAVAAAKAGTQARAQARTQATDVSERLAPVIAPVIDDARDRLAPVVDDARERLVDLTGTVATRIDDLTSGVSDRLDDLTGTVATRLDEALPDRYTPAVVAARVPAKRHPNRLLQAVFVLGLGTVAALVTRRLTGGSGSAPAWRTAADQPSTPDGAPATNATASTPASAAGLAAAATAGESANGLIAGNERAAGSTTDADTTVTGPVETSVDVAGGTPEEVAADATDTPHAVTTPDEPAHKVVLD